MRQRYKTNGQLDYEFDELALDDSDNLYNGSALIVYEYESADPEVGIFGAGFGWYVENITLEINGHKLILDWKQNKELFDDLEKAIIKQFDESIYNAIQADAEL